MYVTAELFYTIGRGAGGQDIALVCSFMYASPMNIRNSLISDFDCRAGANPIDNENILNCGRVMTPSRSLFPGINNYYANFH